MSQFSDPEAYGNYLAYKKYKRKYKLAQICGGGEGGVTIGQIKRGLPSQKIYKQRNLGIYIQIIKREQGGTLVKMNSMPGLNKVGDVGYYIMQDLDLHNLIGPHGDYKA